jgi:hypothetical protein
MSQFLSRAAAAPSAVEPDSLLSAYRRFAGTVRALLSLSRERNQQPSQPVPANAPPPEPGQQAIQRPPRLPSIVRSRPRRSSNVGFTLSAT